MSTECEEATCEFVDRDARGKGEQPIGDHAVDGCATPAGHTFAQQHRRKPLPHRGKQHLASSASNGEPQREGVVHFPSAREQRADSRDHR